MAKISFIPALPDTWYVEWSEAAECRVYAVHAWMCEIDQAENNPIHSMIPMIQEYVFGALNPGHAAQHAPENATVVIGRENVLRRCHEIDKKSAFFVETEERYSLKDNACE